MAGGGGQQGGVVVGGPAPWAAGVAGVAQANAARAAADAATQQTNLAINVLREQYANSFINLKPYTKTGIQALNELNQYLGLNAYDPGTPPKEIVKPSYESVLGDVTRQD